MPSPACAMTRMQWFAWATAGRPYSGHRGHKHSKHKHRDHQDVHTPQGSSDIYAPEAVPFCGPYANPRWHVIAGGCTCRGDRRSPGAGAKPARRHSCVRKHEASPACAMTRIQRFAWATAGRPCSGDRGHKHSKHKHRDHQDVHSPKLSTDITHRADHRFLPWQRS